MHAAAVLVGSASPTVDKLAAVSSVSITDDVLDKSIDSVKFFYEALGGSDQVAKGSEMVAEVIEVLKKQLP